MTTVAERNNSPLLSQLFSKGSNYFLLLRSCASHVFRKGIEVQSKFQSGTHSNCRLSFTILSLITIVCFLLLYTLKDDQLRILHPMNISPNITERWFKSSTILEHAKLLELPSILSSYFHRQSDCSIEVYGFEGVEQDYISGTLLRDIRQICSCRTHYRKLESFVNDTLEVEASALSQSHNIARLIWCIGQCPDFIFKHCMDEKHSNFCQKHVVLINSDEQLVHNIQPYPYFAAVYRNYLRRDSGNHLSYLTQHIRKLPRTNDLLYLHRVLNWSLAIDIMRDEWKSAGIDVDDVSVTPAPDVVTRLNNRIIKRLSLEGEGITYHTWPDLDANTRNQTQKNVPVFWLPLGHTIYYLTNAVKLSIGPLSKRRNLWSWSGSMKFNEREDMKSAFQQNDKLTNYIKQRGFLTTTGGFGEGPHYMDYTSQLLESQFIPLPRGSSPEQFRSYETVNAGAIPIVHEQWLKIEASMEMAPLAYLNVLGYDPVTLSNFTALPKKLLELSRLPSELLDEWQSIMLLRHSIVMYTVTRHMASVLCAANTPHGYVYQAEQELS